MSTGSKFTVAISLSYVLGFSGCQTDDTQNSQDMDSEFGDRGTDSEIETESGSESSDSCLEAVSIHCGDQLGGTTVGGFPNVWGAYDCSAMGFLGPESLYLFVPDHDGEVEVRLTDLSADVDLSLFMTPECDSTGAMMTTNECQIKYISSPDDLAITFTAQSGVSQYLIIDAHDDDAGSYTLEMNCAK
jgi:hypothetical protein